MRRIGTQCHTTQRIYATWYQRRQGFFDSQSNRVVIADGSSQLGEPSDDASFLVYLVVIRIRVHWKNNYSGNSRESTTIAVMLGRMGRTSWSMSIYMLLLAMLCLEDRSDPQRPFLLAAEAFSTTTVPRLSAFLRRTTVRSSLAIDSSSESTLPRTFVELYNPLGGAAGSNRLPATYVTAWPTFVLDLLGVVNEEPQQLSIMPPNADRISRNTADDGVSGEKQTDNSINSSDRSPPWRWSVIPDEFMVSLQERQQQQPQQSGNGGFVNPVTLDTLWHPQDLKAPQLRLAIGLHVRNGQVRHIFPAVDLFYYENDNNNDIGNDSGNDVANHESSSSSQRHYHRNRGLCTVPRAHQWMDFGAYLFAEGTGDKDFRSVDFASLSCRLETCGPAVNRNTKDGVETQNSQSSESADSATSTNLEQTWSMIQYMDDISAVVNLALTALATDPPIQLGDGSCIVHVLQPPLMPTYTTDELPSCPIRNGSQIRAVLEDKETDANGVSTIVGTLQVQVEATAAGSESEYRPDCYVPLFTNPSFRRAAFTETRQRQQKLHQNI